MTTKNIDQINQEKEYFEDLANSFFPSLLNIFLQEYKYCEPHQTPVTGAIIVVDSEFTYSGMTSYIASTQIVHIYLKKDFENDNKMKASICANVKTYLRTTNIEFTYE
jgi:hypothetical protein